MYGSVLVAELLTVTMRNNDELKVNEVSSCIMYLTEPMELLHCRDREDALIPVALLEGEYRATLDLVLNIRTADQLEVSGALLYAQTLQ